MANLLLRAVVAVSVSACSNAGVKIAPTGTGGAAYGGGGTQPSGGESSGAGGSDRDAPSAFTIPDVSADQAPSPGP
ncbi:MAG TPA: hypothetical protein VGG33_09170, partial [Polyangia bacterium]